MLSIFIMPAFEASETLYIARPQPASEKLALSIFRATSRSFFYFKNLSGIRMRLLIGTNARFWGNSLQSWRNRARKELKSGFMAPLRVSLLEGVRGDEGVVRSARWCNEMRPHFFQKSGFSVRV